MGFFLYSGQVFYTSTGYLEGCFGFRGIGLSKSFVTLEPSPPQSDPVGAGVAYYVASSRLVQISIVHAHLGDNLIPDIP